MYLFTVKPIDCNRQKNVRWVFLTLILVLSVFLFSAQPSFADNNTKKNQHTKDLSPLFSKFRHYAVDAMKKRGIPGMAIAVVKDGKIVYSEAFGVKKAGGSDPVRTDTLFQIGSTSKAFTSCLVAMMIDENKIKWNDKVIDHFSDFRMYDPWVTREFMIKDLMAQHSGLKGYSGDFQSFLGFDRDHIIKSIRHIKPISSFRSEFAYQNNLFLVAAKIVELKTGKSWEENIKTRIFEPLGMKNSSMSLKDFYNSGNNVTPHELKNGKAIAIPDNWSYNNWAYIYGPAGGINSNVIDMSKWLALQMNEGTNNGKQLVSKQNLRFLHTPQTVAARDKSGALQSYCEGWVCREYSPHPIIWHNGGTTGCNTMVALIPEEKLGIVILTNATESMAMADALGYQFFDMYYGKPNFDWNKVYMEENRQNRLKAEKEEKEAPKPVILPTLPISQCTGKYKNPVYGEIELITDSNNLTFIIGPSKIKVTLKPWSGNIYNAEVQDIDGDAGNAIFEMDSSGKVVNLTLDYLNQDGLGKFKKTPDND